MSADVPFNTSAPFTADTLRELIEATCSTTREFDDWVSLNGASASDDRLLHGMRLRYLAREFHAEQARYNNGLTYQGPVEGMRPSASTHRNPTQSVYTDHSHTSNIPWSGTRVQQQQLHQHSQPPQQQHYHEQFPPLNQTQQTWTGSRAQQQYMRQQAWATTASNAAPTNTQAFHGSDPQQVHPTSAVPHTSTHCTVQPNSTTNRHQHSDTRQQTATTAPRAYTLGDFAVGNQGTPTVRQLPHQQCEPQHQPAGTQYTDSTPASMPVVQRPTGSIRQFRYTRKPYKQLWKNASSTKAGGKQRRRQQHQQQPPQKPQQHGGYAQEVPTGKQHSRQTQQTGSATNGASNTPIDSQPNQPSTSTGASASHRRRPPATKKRSHVAAADSDEDDDEDAGVVGKRCSICRLLKSQCSCTSDTPSRMKRCRKCKRLCANGRELFIHQRLQHGNNEGLQEFEHELGSNDEGLREIYNAHLPQILAPHSENGGGMRTYNFPINGISDDLNEIQSALADIERNQDNRFRINISFGILLRRADGHGGYEYRYFAPHETSPLLLEGPWRINSTRDIQKLIDELVRMDLNSFLLNQRPNSSWKLFFIPNMEFYLYPLDYTFGYGVEIPPYIRNMRSIITLAKDARTNKPYNDKLCAFRALACLLNTVTVPTYASVVALFTTWCTFTGQEVKPRKFLGLELERLPEFEECFGVNVNVYELLPCKSAVPHYRSVASFPQTLYLNLYNEHLSFIKNFTAYARSYQCPQCERQFKTMTNMKQHLLICSNATKYVFPSGFVKPKQTLFDELTLLCDIELDRAQRSFDSFIVFDFESILESVQVRSSDKLVWTHKHRPISVSVCSNVEGYKEPVCFVDADLDKLLESMLQCMKRIAAKSYALATQKWAVVFQRLEQLQEQYDMSIRDVYTGNEEPDEQAKKQISANRSIKRTIENLSTRFESYCRQIPVLSFNGARYDLNLVKAKFAKKLDLANDPKSFTIKKANAYVAVSNTDFRFLDISQYLSAGSSYSQFLKAFGATVEKGFFPYEFLNSEARLDHPMLPAYPDFYSELKKRNVLDEDGKGAENYAWMTEIWQSENMSTVKDLLIWYNNRDCIGFVEAVEKMRQFYLENDIDLFKDCVSVPGVARILLFRAAGEAKFPLFSSDTQDIYRTICASAAGGPSIVFNRHHEKDKTYIRGNPTKPCKTILGQDANALYLNCFRHEFPTGAFVDRVASNQFKPVPSVKFMAMYFWLDFQAEQNKVNIKHRLNNENKEVYVGRFPVDGFDTANMTVYEFQGCYYHPHDNCPLVSEKNRSATRVERTAAKLDYLEGLGYTVVQIQECVYQREIEPVVGHIIDRYLPRFYRANKGKALSAPQIQRAVCAGELFGLVEVDIGVPVAWNTGSERQYLLNDQRPFEHATMTPYEYFEEFSPLFLTADIPFEAFGPHMQAHIETNNVSKKPRTLLVGGLYAKNMLLASPLLKWYLEHGLVVTKIHRVVEFTPKACFRDFADMVADARRKGDADKSKAIIADTCKLWGNSAFGSVLMNKERHRSVSYVDSSRKMKMKVNDPRFRHMTVLGDDHFEIESSKLRIRLDVPNYLGFFILNYAKMHMLSYYYDCLDYYVPRSCFELTQIDTDSAYFAISDEKFINIVRPELRNEYTRKIEGQCGIGPIEADGSNWYPRTCCERDAKFDRRTPGLFKLEAEGHTMISLASKTYLLLQEQSSKMSAKGLMNHLVTDAPVKFRDVLLTKQSSGGQNIGFRAKDNTMFTYQQSKGGFSYTYVKREVLADGVRTRPLRIVLNPLCNDDIEYVQQSHVLSDYYPASLTVRCGADSIEFLSVHHCFCYLKAVHHNLVEEANAVLRCRTTFSLKNLNPKLVVSDSWRVVRVERMTEILYCKWLYSGQFRNALRLSKDCIIVCGLRSFWDCGCKYSLARVTKRGKFSKCNKLGALLEQLRHVTQNLDHDRALREYIATGYVHTAVA